MARLTVAHELIGDNEAVDESRARRLEAEGGHGRDTELFLQEASDVRENQVRRRRSDEHEIDVSRSQPGVGDRRARGMGCEIARRFVFGRNVPALDAGTSPDPLIGRVDHLLEVKIRQNSFRQVFSRADYS